MNSKERKDYNKMLEKQRKYEIMKENDCKPICEKPKAKRPWFDRTNYQEPSTRGLGHWYYRKDTY